MNLQFEKAALADAETLVEIQIRAFHEDAKIYPGVTESGPPDYDSLEVMRDDIEKGFCHKILLDGQIVGGMVVFHRQEAHYHLHIIHIDPPYHGKGIGTKAMQFIEAAYPAKKWTLDTPAYATRNHYFYEKLGYIKVGEVPETDDLMLFSYEKLMSS